MTTPERKALLQVGPLIDLILDMSFDQENDELEDPDDDGEATPLQKLAYALVKKPRARKTSSVKVANALMKLS